MKNKSTLFLVQAAAIGARQVNMKNKSTLFLVQAAAIGAIYVVITLLFAPLSFGEVQIRDK